MAWPWYSPGCATSATSAPGKTGTLGEHLVDAGLESASGPGPVLAHHRVHQHPLVLHDLDAGATGRYAAVVLDELAKGSGGEADEKDGAPEDDPDRLAFESVETPDQPPVELAESE